MSKRAYRITTLLYWLTAAVPATILLLEIPLLWSSSVVCVVIAGLIAAHAREAALRAQALKATIQMSMRDELTGIANRRLFLDELRTALGRPLEKGEYTAVFYLDMDGFKSINDTLGHTAGDKVLVEVASRMRECIPPPGVIGRMGGDEFTALINEVNNRQEIVTTAQAIMEQFARPVEVSGQKVWINASMGIVMASMPRPGADDLLTMADTALYHAKDRGKGQFVLFEPSLPRPALRSLSLDADLRMAVQRNELVLHFQPIVTLDTLCIAGFEALIRWRHPRLGLLSPNDFIPMAEESGLIRSLGAWIIEQGCERLSVWQSVHGKPLTLNINLSALQFRQRDILSHLATISDRSGLMPGSLQLEITESVLMQDDGQTLKNLSDLHRLGFGIAIDDFGVGYSSLSYLKRFRVDSLKLDQSFMKDLDDPRSEALVKGTIQLGHSLGVIVVAEGIETREQLELLRKAGCDQGQGYLLGRPMDEFQVMDMLSSGAFLKPWVTEGKGVESDDAVTGKGWQAAVA